MYTLVTSTLTWDTLRALTTVLGILIIGRPVCSRLCARAKPVTAPTAIPVPALR